MAGKVIDEFVFDHRSSVDAIVNAVVTVQEKENLLGQQNLTPDADFLGAASRLITMAKAEEIMNSSITHQFK